jgi:NADH-quinone oxidoreductase subunit L
MFRLVGMTFFGKSRADEHVKAHIHESPKSMTTPLIALAILSVIGGLLGVPAALGHLVGLDHSHLLHSWLAPAMAVPTAIHHEIPTAEYVLMILSLCIAISGCYVGYVIYTRRQDIPQNFARRFSRIYQTVYNKYYVDEIYDLIFVKGVKLIMNFAATFDARVIDGFVNLSAFMTKIVSWISGWFDLIFVDGIVNGISDSAQASGKKLRLLQTGRIQNYVYVLVAGVLVFMFWRLVG